MTALTLAPALGNSIGAFSICLVASLSSLLWSISSRLRRSRADKQMRYFREQANRQADSQAIEVENIREKDGLIADYDPDRPTTDNLASVEGLNVCLRGSLELAQEGKKQERWMGMVGQTVRWVGTGVVVVALAHGLYLLLR